jgi:hypothetical protein
LQQRVRATAATAMEEHAHGRPKLRSSLQTSLLRGGTDAPSDAQAAQTQRGVLRGGDAPQATLRSSAADSADTFPCTRFRCRRIPARRRAISSPGQKARLR